MIQAFEASSASLKYVKYKNDRVSYLIMINTRICVCGGGQTVHITCECVVCVCVCMCVCVCVCSILYYNGIQCI